MTILFGAAAVRTQLAWCRKQGARSAIITHCGSEFVTGDERRLDADIREMARELGPETRIAYDGMELIAE